MTISNDSVSENKGLLQTINETRYKSYNHIIEFSYFSSNYKSNTPNLFQ